MDFESAAQFLWTHARLLERRLFEHRFLGGSAGAVVGALDAYRNQDGGFGQALEPDCRTPHSQPEPMRWALELLREVGALDGTRAASCADWLASVATAEGGVPFCLPSVDGYPRAPWWSPSPEPDLNPTGRIVGLLRDVVPEHPWVSGAAAWCWERVVAELPADQYGVHSAVEFLLGEPDAERARPLLATLGERLGRGDVVPVDPAVTGPRPDTHTPLHFAPSPDHPLRGSFADDVVEGFLDRLEAEQQEDGGWPIDWPAPGESAVCEWRAIKTLEALETLRAYGRS